MTIEVGTKVKWTSQAGGTSREKIGVVVKLISRASVPYQIANREFPNHVRLFDGQNIPSWQKNDQAYFVEVRPSERSKPRLYMPNPSKLEIIKEDK